jgi:hypothetical protein
MWFHYCSKIVAAASDAIGRGYMLLQRNVVLLAVITWVLNTNVVQVLNALDQRFPNWWVASRFVVGREKFLKCDFFNKAHNIRRILCGVSPLPQYIIRIWDSTTTTAKIGNRKQAHQSHTPQYEK